MPTLHPVNDNLERCIDDTLRGIIEDSIMTTDKARITIYLSDRRPLDDLTEQLRILAPIEDRGAISRSTAIEAAVSLALEDLRSNGRRSAIYGKLVTSP